MHTTRGWILTGRYWQKVMLLFLYGYINLFKKIRSKRPRTKREKNTQENYYKSKIKIRNIKTLPSLLLSPWRSSQFSPYWRGSAASLADSCSRDQRSRQRAYRLTNQDCGSECFSDPDPFFKRTRIWIWFSGYLVQNPSKIQGLYNNLARIVLFILCIFTKVIIKLYNNSNTEWKKLRVKLIRSYTSFFFNGWIWVHVIYTRIRNPAKNILTCFIELSDFIL